MTKKEGIVVLGLMSGSSLDGLDMVICRFEGSRPEDISVNIVGTKSVDFPAFLTRRLGVSPSLSLKEFFQLETDFSIFCATAISEWLKDSKSSIDLIASHGHTVIHHPEYGFTCQIGKGSIIAERTGIACLTDFRSNDIALGGQGAPLAPVVEKFLYPGYDYYFNLGGIANLSVHKSSEILSMDSCPCNQVLNYLVRDLGKPYDDKGQLARTGVASGDLITDWSKLEYFSQPYPKSMDNSWVKDVFIPIMNRYELSPADKLSSMVSFIAEQLSRDIQLLSSDKKGERSGLITGGGGFNDYLIEKLTEHFQRLNLKLILPVPDVINYKEAILMSLMGYLRIKQIPNTIPSVTGARKASIGGTLYLSS